MSTKRILIIAICGILLIGAAVAVMLVTSFLRSDSAAIELPDTPVSIERPNGSQTDVRDRIDVTPDNVQAVISTLLPRPGTYSRDIIVESFWEDGGAETKINVSVTAGMTSLRIVPPVGVYKRIIVTPDAEYIWFSGDIIAFRRTFGASGDSGRVSDEWQMLLTFEDVLSIDKNDILDADYTDFEGNETIYVVYRTRPLGHTRTIHISLELGLIIAAFEHDLRDVLVYRMTAGSFSDESEPGVFVLPDGTDLEFGNEVR